MQSSASEKTIYEYLLLLKNGSILLMHQTVLRSIYSVQLFWAAGRRQTEVNLALLNMLVGVWNVLRLHGMPNWLSSSETLSGKIHCVLGIMVDLHSFSQGLRISAVALSRHMTAFCTVKRIKQTNKKKNRCNKGPCQTSHVSNLILRTCFKLHVFTALDSRSEAQAVVP